MPHIACSVFGCYVISQDHVICLNPYQYRYAVQTCQMVTRTKKMFVGGLSASTTIDDVKAYFESYGKVK